MGKVKRFFVKNNGKWIQISKEQLTSRGNYLIPLPQVQKKMGGIDLHQSYEAGGEIQHLKSRKLGFEIDGSPLELSKEIFPTISEDYSLENLPANSEGILIPPNRFWGLMEQNIKRYTRESEYFDMDNYFLELNKEKKITIPQIKNKEHGENDLIFFFIDNFVYYYFKNELKRIDKNNFWVLGLAENSQ